MGRFRGPFRAVAVAGCIALPCGPPAPFGWEGDFRSERVVLTSERTGAQLAGTAFAPPVRRARRGDHPVVVIVPGSGGIAREEHYHWAARDLASHGYVVLGVDPQGVGRSAALGDPACGAPDDLEYPYPCRGVPFQQRPNFDDAALSGIEFLLGARNPYRRLVDRRRVGVAGHSLGAGAAIAAQERDERVDAIVAWDGLSGREMATDTNAPTHHVVNGHVPADGQLDRDVAVRAPALALHSDHETTSPYDTDPQKKNRGWFHWRAANMPSVVFTLRDVTHAEYEQPDAGPVDEPNLRRLAWYTRAWFDLHLKRDTSATSRLLAADVLGAPRSEVLSGQFPSAVFLPGSGIDCEDVREPCEGMP